MAWATGKAAASGRAGPFLLPWAAGKAPIREPFRQQTLILSSHWIRFTNNLHPIPDIYVEAYAARTYQLWVDGRSVDPDDGVLAPGGGELGFQGERPAGYPRGEVANGQPV